MTTRAALLSVGLTLHTIALCLSSVPSQAQIYALRGRASTDPHQSARFLDGLADAAQRVLLYVPHDQPVLRAARAYTGALGLQPLWQMFSNPPLRNSYLAARFWVIGADGTPTIWNELLLPASRGQLRHPGKLVESFRDKALSNALEAHLDAQRESPGHPRTTTGRFGVDVLGAVSRWAAWRFQNVAMRQGERLARVDLLYGAIPIPGPGAPWEPYVREQARALSGLATAGPAIEQERPESSASFKWFEIDRRAVE